MKVISKENENQKEINEFMVQHNYISMSDLIGYVLNHLSQYPTMHVSFNEYQTDNGRKFIVTIEEERLIPIEIEVVK